MSTATGGQRVVAVERSPLLGTSWVITDSARRHSVDGPYAQLPQALRRAERYRDRWAPEARLQHPLECICQEVL